MALSHTSGTYNCCESISAVLPTPVIALILPSEPTVFSLKEPFRSLYFQNNGKGDHAHLNDKGHDLLVEWGERFLEGI